MSHNCVWDIFEWKNCTYPGESSAGFFVTMTPDGIRLAEPNDEILGITMEAHDVEKGKDRSRVGIFGVLTVRDNGTCVPGQKCNVSAEHIAVPGDQWMVISRQCDCLVKILFK